MWWPRAVSSIEWSISGEGRFATLPMAVDLDVKVLSKASKVVRRFSKDGPEQAQIGGREKRRLKMRMFVHLEN